MQLKEWRERLNDPEYTAAFLDRILTEKGHTAFLNALKEVVDARGGIGKLTRKVPFNRRSMYKMMSSKGNPTLSTLLIIFKALGLQLAVAVASPKNDHAPRPVAPLRYGSRVSHWSMRPEAPLASSGKSKTSA